jgi:hypothetical protein
MGDPVSQQAHMVESSIFVERPIFVLPSLVNDEHRASIRRQSRSNHQDRNQPEQIVARVRSNEEDLNQDVLSRPHIVPPLRRPENQPREPLRLQRVSNRPRMIPPALRMPRVSHGTHTISATTTEPEVTLQVAGGNVYTCKDSDFLKRRLKQHRRFLAYFDPSRNHMVFPQAVKNTLSFSDGRVLVRFEFQDREDMLVHIQLCTNLARREATRPEKVLASVEGDEIASWTRVGPPTAREKGMWKVRHLIRATRMKVQLRWMGGGVQWVKRCHLSDELRDNVDFLVRRYKEERASGVEIHKCSLV